MIKIVFATNNQHKVSEFKSYFSQMGIDAEIKTIRETGFDGEIIENADTFEGNAYIKAKTAGAEAPGGSCSRSGPF